MHDVISRLQGLILVNYKNLHCKNNFLVTLSQLKAHPTRANNCSRVQITPTAVQIILYVVHIANDILKQNRHNSAILHL